MKFERNAVSLFVVFFVLLMVCSSAFAEWSAKIEQVSKINAGQEVQVSVYFTDGERSFSRSFTVQSKSDLIAQVKQEMERLENVEVLVEQLEKTYLDKIYTKTQLEALK